MGHLFFVLLHCAVMIFSSFWVLAITVSLHVLYDSHEGYMERQMEILKEQNELLRRQQNQRNQRNQR